MPTMIPNSPNLLYPLQKVKEELNEVIDRWRHTLSRRTGNNAPEPVSAPATAPAFESGDWMLRPFESDLPRIEIDEGTKAVHVRAELPGLAPADFTVEVESSNLVLRGEKRNQIERRNEERGTYYSECSYGSFRRTIPLGFEADESKIKARYKNGVLDIEVPRPKELQRRGVKVQVLD